MPHWAEIDDDNKVLRVTYGEGADEETHQWLIDRLGGIWVRTYYDTPGQTYAGAGYTWDPQTGDFIPPAPTGEVPGFSPQPESTTPPPEDTVPIVPSGDQPPAEDTPPADTPADPEADSSETPTP